MVRQRLEIGMDKKRVDVNRRRVLQASIGISATTALVQLGSTSDANAYSPGDDETRARYRESEHVKEFYRTNGYETKSRT